MAMRPRGGRGGATFLTRKDIVQPVYEDFKPISEWKEDDESHILNIHLPGFFKQQVKVSTEGRNIIRVHGERLAAGNKMRRFLEDFQVPENGQTKSVRAMFQDGILRITVPKRPVEKSPHDPPVPIPKQNDDINQPATKTDEPKAIPQPYASNGTSIKPMSPDADQNQTVPQNGAADISRSAEEKSIESRPKLDTDQMDARVTQFKNGGDIVSGVDEKKLTGESEETVTTTPETGGGPTSVPETRDYEKELYRAEASDKHIKGKAVKGLAGLDEERQLLVNMGVALLVVVAVTAYATYKFASAKG